jgi:hypothetical protein
LDFDLDESERDQLRKSGLDSAHAEPVVDEVLVGANQVSVLGPGVGHMFDFEAMEDAQGGM